MVSQPFSTFIFSCDSHLLSCRIIEYLNTDGSRSYIDVYTDAGTYFDESYTRKYGIVFWIGQWHCQKNFLSIIMKLLHYDNVHPLMCIWGFQTPCAQDCLFRVSHVRRTCKFLFDGLTPALFRCLIEEYCSLSPENSSFEGLQEYILDQSHADQTFSNYLYLLFDILMPMLLLYNGIKENNMDSYDCGRLKLLPFCFALNHSIYGPRIVREFIQLYFQVNDEVREHHRRFFSFGGKGIDERMEEQNKSQQAILSENVPTRKSILTASICQESYHYLSTNLFSVLSIGKKKNSLSSKKDTSKEVQEMVHFLRRAGIFC